MVLLPGCAGLDPWIQARLSLTPSDRRPESQDVSLSCTCVSPLLSATRTVILEDKDEDKDEDEGEDEGQRPAEARLNSLRPWA